MPTEEHILNFSYTDDEQFVTDLQVAMMHLMLGEDERFADIYNALSMTLPDFYVNEWSVLIREKINKDVRGLLDFLLRANEYIKKMDGKKMRMKVILEEDNE